MASIRKELQVGADPEVVWAALRDFGAVHERIAPGFVTDSVLEGRDRVVTFFNGMQVRERLVGVDDEHRRLVYSVVDGPLGFDHHQATVEVQPAADGCGSRFVWTTDLLPDDAAPAIAGMMDQGAGAIARCLSPEPSGPPPGG